MSAEGRGGSSSDVTEKSFREREGGSLCFEHLLDSPLLPLPPATIISLVKLFTFFIHEKCALVPEGNPHILLRGECSFNCERRIALKQLLLATDGLSEIQALSVR